MKKFIINTYNEQQYNELIKDDKINQEELYIIDDNDTNRLIIPTNDLVDKKIQSLIPKIDNIYDYTIGQLFEMIFKK